MPSRVANSSAGTAPARQERAVPALSAVHAVRFHTNPTRHQARRLRAIDPDAHLRIQRRNTGGKQLPGHTQTKALNVFRRTGGSHLSGLACIVRVNTWLLPAATSLHWTSLGASTAAITPHDTECGRPALFTIIRLVQCAHSLADRPVHRGRTLSSPLLIQHPQESTGHHDRNPGIGVQCQ
jgi:hypothetical protein